MSAFSDSNISHDCSYCFVFSIQIINLFTLGKPFIATSPQKIMLSFFSDIESFVCPGVNKIFPCNKSSRDFLFSSFIVMNLSLNLSSMGGNRCSAFPKSPIRRQKSTQVAYCILRQMNFALVLKLKLIPY